MDRRDFFKTAVAGATTAALAAEVGRTIAHAAEVTPCVVSSANGINATAKAMELIKAGEDTLDAVIAGVNLVEEDPEDTSVGYGGLPNENGVVQLDSSVMHGPTNGAGAVACIENIKYPSKVARDVMQKTDHVLLVGEGALKFAVAMGYEQENLLTDQAREMWMKWKRSLSDRDDWIEPEERIPESMRTARRAAPEEIVRDTGTINCNAINARGDISGVTTTSGLSYKIPGRVGDSPIIGAGLYVDNEVGACGSTGRGEANLKSCASFLVVEFMRQGMSPEEAGLQALKRIAEKTTEPYLLREDGRPAFDLKFYALNKKGEFAGTVMWSGAQYAAHDGTENKLRDCAYLFERDR